MEEKKLRPGDPILYIYNYKATFKGELIEGTVSVKGYYGYESGMDKEAKRLVRQTLLDRFVGLTIEREEPIKFYTNEERGRKLL